MTHEECYFQGLRLTNHFCLLLELRRFIRVQFKQRGWKLQLCLVKQILCFIVRDGVSLAPTEMSLFIQDKALTSTGAFVVSDELHMAEVCGQKMKRAGLPEAASREGVDTREAG